MTDDKDEILLIGRQLERRRLYGAAQLIFRLARERDEALGRKATIGELTSGDDAGVFTHDKPKVD